MTRHLRPEEVLDRDWGEVWERLPEAPPLVPRPKTAQVTLRVPGPWIGRLKSVAAVRSLAYHSLVRTWIASGVRSGVVSRSGGGGEEQSAQLNLKVEQELLDALKRRAGELQRPYHALAREYIHAALVREEKELGIGSSPGARPSAVGRVTRRRRPAIVHPD